MGLGPLHSVTLAEARAKAEGARALVRQGIDPIEHRSGIEAIEAARAVEGNETFGDYADAFIADAVKSGRWRGKKTEARWRNLMTRHAAPIREKALADISVTDVLATLRPLWGVRQESAEKLREAIERVLDAARVEGKREGDNPARWRGNLEHVLHKPDALSRTKHHEAMPAEAVPGFWKRLKEDETVASAALQLSILTVARPSEAREAQWAEFDLAEAIWYKPPERTKAGKPHRVPLSPAAMAVLQSMKKVQLGDYVFPGAKRGRPISDTSMRKAMEGANGAPYTAHGFRSTFRDWVTDIDHSPRELAELALSHAVGDAVERAYARSDALERRRPLMERWGDYVTGGASGKTS